MSVFLVVVKITITVTYIKMERISVMQTCAAFMSFTCSGPEWHHKMICQRYTNDGIIQDFNIVFRNVRELNWHALHPRR
jgi:hypothetical protein